MEFRKTLSVLIIIIISIMIIMSGVTYAWYAYSNAQSVVKGSTMKETPTVIFSQTEYISSSTSMPIYDDDRYTYGNRNSFNITFTENLKDYEIGIEISLNNIVMANELKITNYKYELLQNDLVISQGNFASLGDSTSLKLLPMTLIIPTKYPETYHYELYIWLSEDGTNQNDLMAKGFTAKVNIDSIIKRQRKGLK